MTKRWWLAAAAALASACATGGAMASFQGVSTPVLLGPRDRVGTSKAAPANKLDGFESTAREGTSEQTDSARINGRNYDVTYTNQYATSGAVNAVDVARATHGTPGNEIRVKGIDTSSWVVGFGGGSETSVEVDGDVVHVPGAER